METEAQCLYCGQYYPTPVGHYHSEEECLENQKTSSENLGSQQ